MVRQAVERVPEAARRQGGVFTRRQALADGWSERQVQRRLAARRWSRVAGQGLALSAPAWTPFQLASAAWLTWPDCVVSHLTAAALHGFPVEAGQRAHVITNRGRPSSRSIRAHVLPLAEPELRTWPGAGLLTSRQRTLVDCLCELDLQSGLDLYAWASTRGLVDHPALSRLAEQSLGRHGAPRLRRLVRLTATGAVSAAEHALHLLLRQAGIRGWTAGAAVHDRHGLIGVADLLFEAERLVVEVDGWRAHSSRTAFVADRRRQNRLVAAGYLVLRFTWDDLTQRPAQVLTDIRRALSRRERVR